MQWWEIWQTAWQIRLLQWTSPSSENIQRPHYAHKGFVCWCQFDYHLQWNHWQITYKLDLKTHHLFQTTTLTISIICAKPEGKIYLWPTCQESNIIHVLITHYYISSSPDNGFNIPCAGYYWDFNKRVPFDTSHSTEFNTKKSLCTGKKILPHQIYVEDVYRTVSNFPPVSYWTYSFDLHYNKFETSYFIALFEDKTLDI